MLVEWTKSGELKIAIILKSEVNFINSYWTRIGPFCIKVSTSYKAFAVQTNVHASQIYGLVWLPTSLLFELASFARSVSVLRSRDLQRFFPHVMSYILQYWHQEYIGESQENADQLPSNTEFSLTSLYAQSQAALIPSDAYLCRRHFYYMLEVRWENNMKWTFFFNLFNFLKNSYIYIYIFFMYLGV